MLAKTLAKLALIAGLSAAALTSARAQTEINFGIISTEATANLEKQWLPYLEAMSKATGLTIKPFFASDYTGIIEAQRFNKVQVAWYGNKSAMTAVDRAEGEVFVQSVAKSGEKGYYSHVIVPASSSAQTLDDILKCDKSLNFSIGDPQSTSGFLVPTTFIFAERGINPADCFKTLRNAKHEANALATANAQVDAATFNSEGMDRLKATNPEAAAKIRIIWTSPLIPSDPIVWRKDLDPAVKSQLMNFFMSYGRLGTEEEIKAARAILGELGWAPFVPSSNAQLNPIRILEVSKEISKANADEKLSAADKAAKVAELQKQIDAIKASDAALPRM